MCLRKQRDWLHGRMSGLRSSGVLLACAAWAGMVLGAETPPKPAMRVPLSELGFPGYALSLMHAGWSMATVHMLDSSHVMFTYSLRSLVPRLPGDDANDTDREVAAVLVEVPSGKVLARTKWHLHDHGQYLWDLGQGRFALRIGNDLSLIAPMQMIASGQGPFVRYALPHRPGQPVVVTGSPDGRVITVEVESEIGGGAENGDEEGRKKKHYTLEFYRVEQPGDPKLPMQVSDAGAVGSPMALHLPLDGDGYLWAEDGERGKWYVSFNEFGGKQQPLAPVLSSCNPRLDLLSRSEFLVEMCRGANQEPMLASYGFDGHENWEEQFGEALQPATLRVAPRAGRFAMSRVVASTSADSATSTLAGDDPINQEIRVYQTESGDMLLHLRCVPAVRTAENFDISPDGRVLVVLAPETLDLYRLPELSVRDRKDLAEAQTMTPPTGSGPVALTRITRPVAAPSESAEPQSGSAVAANSGARDRREGDGVAGVAPATASVGAATVAGASLRTTAGTAAGSVPMPAVAASAQAPAQPEAVTARKPPTLLNPGESPEFKGRPAAPQ